MSAQVNLPLARVPASHFGADEADMVHYREEGTERALAMDNRGPVELGPDGKLIPEIVAAYERHGFYVFTGVVGKDELAEIERDVAEILERAPVEPDGKLDRNGRPAMAADCEGRNFGLVRPLSDPYGGTEANHGRHQIKMAEPAMPQGAPPWVAQVLLGALQHSDACLRYAGHPQLLAVVASLNGDDFTPFNETIWIKHPYLGGSVSWHQDGWTHWNSPDLDYGTHGFNTMMQLYGCDAANGLWVVPGTHRQGRLDIRAMRDGQGTDRLPDAVPLICGPGDIAVTNRQAVHGSFANTSPNPRVSITIGFHRRKSVLGVTSGGVHNAVALYDEAYIERRSRLVMYAIDARRQRYPKETPFVYTPFAGREAEFRWTAAARKDIHDYNLQDLGI